MIKQHRNLNEMARTGWSPTYHGESLDCYNKRSSGGYSPPYYAATRSATTGSWSLTATAQHQ